MDTIKVSIAITPSLGGSFFMSKRTKYILITILIFLSAIVFSHAYFLYSLHSPVDTKIIATSTSPQSSPTKERRNSAPSPWKEKAGDEVLQIRAIIKVAGISYEANIQEGKNVYDLMTTLANNNSGFSFHAKEYTGLGYFVDEINGIKGTSGKYWIYYINNRQASIGISAYVVKNGDVIEWKQE